MYLPHLDKKDQESSSMYDLNSLFVLPPHEPTQAMGRVNRWNPDQRNFQNSVARLTVDSNGRGRARNAPYSVILRKEFRPPGHKGKYFYGYENACKCMDILEVAFGNAGGVLDFQLSPFAFAGLPFDDPRDEKKCLQLIEWVMQVVREAEDG